jgi:Transglycosylase SLT domain
MGNQSSTKQLSSRGGLQADEGSALRLLSTASKFLAIGFITLFVTQLYAAELADLRNGFTLRHDHHEVVGDTTRLYMSADPAGGYVDVQTDQIAGYETAPPDPTDTPAPIAKAADLKAIVAEVSAKNKLDADFIASVIAAESAGNPHAVSPKGSQGLMQLMPGTADRLGVKDSFDPQANVDGGVRYLRQLLELYHYDVAKALAAYNAGPKRVDQYKGVPPYRETHAYVARIIKDYNRKKLAQQKAVAQQKRAQVAKPQLASASSDSAN